MSHFIILSEKSWHADLPIQLGTIFSEDTWTLIHDKNDFTYESILELNPDRIFIPHWSYLIPETIYNQFECIVFHMTDLPYGRGGSPLQNLIIRGHKTTKVSAIRVEAGLDTGPVYLKKPLDLSGTAMEIFERCSDVIVEMVKEIVRENPEPKPQEGEVAIFTRRKPEDGSIAELSDLSQVYDYIRMLDAEGYPPAFIEVNNIRVEFSNASMDPETNTLQAYVRITQK